MSVVEIESKSQFDSLVQSTHYVILQAHAVWCGPCKAISPLFNKHAESQTIPESLVLARFDIDNIPELATDLSIRSVPAFFVFENGNKAGSLTGANPTALQKLVLECSAKVANN